MNMSEKMKERAIKATNTNVSSKVFKTISRAEIEELNTNMEPIIEQNKKEYREMAETINKDDSIYSYSSNNKKNMDEFTDGKAELRAYQFAKYISSCTCYLIDQRLKEKRRLYNGTDDGFISTKNEKKIVLQK